MDVTETETVTTEIKRTAIVKLERNEWLDNMLITQTFNLSKLSINQTNKTKRLEAEPFKIHKVSNNVNSESMSHDKKQLIKREKDRLRKAKSRAILKSNGWVQAIFV